MTELAIKKISWSKKLADNAAKNHKYVRIDLINNKIGSTVISRNVLKSFTNPHTTESLNYIDKDNNDANIRLAVNNLEDLKEVLNNFYEVEDINKMFTSATNHSHYNEALITAEINQRCKSHNYPTPLFQLIMSGDSHAFKTAKVIAGDGNTRYLYKTNEDGDEPVFNHKPEQLGFIDQIKEILKTNSRRMKYINLDSLELDGSGARILGRVFGKLVVVRDDIKYPLVCTDNTKIEIARELISKVDIEQWNKPEDVDMLMKNLDKLTVYFQEIAKEQQEEEERKMKKASSIKNSSVKTTPIKASPILVSTKLGKNKKKKLL